MCGSGLVSIWLSENPNVYYSICVKRSNNVLGYGKTIYTIPRTQPVDNLLHSLMVIVLEVGCVKAGPLDGGWGSLSCEREHRIYIHMVLMGNMSIPFTTEPQSNRGEGKGGREGGRGGRGGSEGGRELRSGPSFPPALPHCLLYLLKLYNVFNDNVQSIR